MKRMISSFLIAAIVLSLPVGVSATSEFTTADALAVLRAAVGLETLTEEQRIKYNLHDDITTNDALFVLRVVMGIENLEEIEEPINIEEEMRKQEMLNTPDEGILKSGVRYEFVAGNFNSNSFFERNNRIHSNEMDVTIIAHSPFEAAENGLRYLSSIRADAVAEFVVNVRFCYETDNWVLGVINLYAQPFTSIGYPNILTINYSDGSVVRHSLDIWRHQIQW